MLIGVLGSLEGRTGLALEDEAGCLTVACFLGCCFAIALLFSVTIANNMAVDRSCFPLNDCFMIRDVPVQPGGDPGRSGVHSAWRGAVNNGWKEEGASVALLAQNISLSDGGFLLNK